MKTLLREEIRKEVRDRLSKLSPDMPRRWGTMSAIQMLAHVSLQLENAVTIRQTPQMKIVWLIHPVRKLLFNLIPWPHGLPTAPDWKNPETENWKYETNRFLSLINKFSEDRDVVKWGKHPLFGKLSGKEWGRLSYRHIDHHFRQFGI